MAQKTKRVPVDLTKLADDLIDMARLLKKAKSINDMTDVAQSIDEVNARVGRMVFEMVAAPNGGKRGCK